MTLSEYVNSFPEKQRAKVRKKIADALGVSDVYIVSMCNGHKKIPGHYALDIERITDGAVPCYVTSPTLYPPERFSGITK